MVKIAFVGTGFVADYYMTTLPNHPGIELAGVWDRDEERLRQFCAFHNVRAYGGLEQCLADPEVAILVNLTTPESHFEINRKALEAGKHVYCEKPLTMRLDDAEMLVALAEDRGLTICTAPANALSDANSHLADLLASGRIGRPRLAYAEMEDGPVFRSAWQSWRSRSGAPWPGLHEFEIGCTLEHAGYGLSWLLSLFGPVAHLSAFSALTFPDKGPGTGHVSMAPDFSVGCLTFESGVVARLTSGLAAPRDRSLTVIGDTGMLVLRDLWDDRSPVYFAEHGARRSLLTRVVDRIAERVNWPRPFRLIDGKPVPHPQKAKPKALPNFPSRIDFARGIATQARAISGGEPAFF
jgi:predicted dehydrogenase